MSAAGVGRNPAKVPFSGNNDRRGGAADVATSRDPEALRFAIATGNRQTKRLALQNLARLERSAKR